MFFISFLKRRSKKTIFNLWIMFLVGTFVLGLFYPVFVGAQESDFVGRSIQEEGGVAEENSVATEPVAESAPEAGLPAQAGILPDSPLYKVKMFFESLATFLTFKPASKAERYVELAEKRVAEMRAMVETGKATEEAIEENVKKFEDYMEKALLYAEEMRKKGETAEELLNKILETAERYKKFSEEFYGKIPEPVKKSIEDSVKWLNQTYQEVLKYIPEEKKNQISQAIEVIKTKAMEFWTLLQEKLKK